MILHWIGLGSLAWKSTSQRRRYAFSTKTKLAWSLLVSTTISSLRPLKLKFFKLLFSLYNNQTPINDWLVFNFNQNFNARNNNCHVFNNPNYKVAKKWNIRKTLHSQWQNSSHIAQLNVEKTIFKIKYKQKFLPPPDAVTS